MVFLHEGDTRFLLKTTTTKEKNVLLKRLRKYTEHVEKQEEHVFAAISQVLLD